MPRVINQPTIPLDDPTSRSNPEGLDEEQHLASTSLTAAIGPRVHRRRALPPAPSENGRPRPQTGPINSGTGCAPPGPDDDPELWAVFEELRRLDPNGIRFGAVLREAFDQIYDGGRTGRWDYSQLMKTEKTHIGTLVEIWLQREFRFPGGEDLDYAIRGIDVDAKWSRNLYEWEIPLEMYQSGDKIALVVWANEYTSLWAAGLIRVSETVLVPAGLQRDRKRKLNLEGRDRILWVHRDRPMIENTLLHINPAIALAIANAQSGQAAINTLFRNVQRQLINRASVVTAAQQVDHGKRVRDARRFLSNEGIIVLGHYHPHPQIAVQLGLPMPSLGRFVSARVAPALVEDQGPHADIDNHEWRIADAGDPVVSAPKLPEQGVLPTPHLPPEMGAPDLRWL